MVDDDLTHYDVLGVEPSADKEQIRAAYQEQLEDIRQEQAREQASKKPNENVLAGARDREARLRSAWQVLSDPYQRGRYDATVEMGTEHYESDDDSGVEVVENGQRPLSPREERARQRAEAMANRPPGMFSPVPSAKPSSWPAVVTPPPPRARSIALFIDLFVLYLIFTVIQIAVAPAVLDSAYPKQSKELDAVADCHDRFNVLDKADHIVLADVTRAEGRKDCQKVRVAFATSEKPRVRLEKDITRVEDRNDALLKKVAGVTYGATLAMLGLMLLYLIPSSIISGRTLGKKLMQVKVIHDDGRPLTPVGALKRYGLPVTAAMLISTIGFGPIGFVVVLFVVLNWPRNPNLQGMHDRLAKTIVIDG